MKRGCLGITSVGFGFPVSGGWLPAAVCWWGFGVLGVGCVCWFGFWVCLFGFWVCLL